MDDSRARMELEAAFCASVQGYNDGLFEDYIAGMHANVSYDIPTYAAPLLGKTIVRGMYEDFLGELDAFHWEAIGPVFVVAGDTGVVLSGFRHTFTPIGKPEIVSEGRNTVVFTRERGRWVKVAESLCHKPVLADKG